MVGGSLMSNLKISHGLGLFKIAICWKCSKKIDQPYDKVGHEVLRTMGHGRSGGGTTVGPTLENRLSWS